jgi:hypothetical protein
MAVGKNKKLGKKGKIAGKKKPCVVRGAALGRRAALFLPLAKARLTDA